MPQTHLAKHARLRSIVLFGLAATAGSLLEVATSGTAGPVHGPFQIQGESGSIVLLKCAPDGEHMSVVGSRMFYPNQACAADFGGLTPLISVDTVTFFMTGHNEVIRGLFFLKDRWTDTVMDSTGRVCAPGQDVTAPFGPLLTLGAPQLHNYRITWWPAPAESNPWIKAVVDFHAGF